MDSPKMSEEKLFTPSDAAGRLTGGPNRRVRILLGFGLFFLAGAGGIALYPPLGTAIYGPPLYPAAVAAFVLVIVTAAILAGMRWREMAVRPERWAIPLAGAVGVALLASPFSDRAAFPALGLLLFPASIILIAAWVEAGANRAARCLNLFRATAVVAIGLALWGLFSWAVIDFGARVGAADHLMEIAGVEDDSAGLWELPNTHPFGHKNFVAGFTILTLPVLLLALWQDRSRLRLLWLGGLPVVLLYLASSESRAAWLAVALGAALYIVLRFWRLSAARVGWWGAPILLVVLAIPFIASPRLRESVQRAGQEESLAAVDPYRWETFQTGMAVGNAYPLTGVGPGALSLVSPEYSASKQFPVVYQVHSTPLQFYAETGAAGVLAGLLLAWGLFRGWRRGRAGRPLAEQNLTDAAAVALVSYSAFALTDYQLDVPAIALAAAVPAGVLLGLGGKSSRPAFAKVWLVAGILSATLLLPTLWFNGKGLLARLHLEKAVAHLNTKEIDSFSSAAERARGLAPTDPFYLNQLANVWMTEWMRAEDPADRARYSEKARMTLDRSLEIAPAQDSVHFNRGILLRQDNPSEALESFQSALKYNPRKRFAWFLSGQALLALDREEEVAEAFARELLVNPTSLFLPLWQDASVRPHIEARNRHYEELIRTEWSSPPHRYLFHWYTGSTRKFEGTLRYTTPGFRVLLEALEGDPEGAIAKGPATSEALLVRAWLEPDEAEKWLRAAFFKANGSAFSQSNLELIGDRLREADTFGEAFRALVEEPGLPGITKQGRPRASGLFERNFYGAPLYDFFVYHEPIALLLF